MSRPPATSRKVRRVLVLPVLLALRATQTARALLGAGAVPFPRSVPPGTWARNLLVARRARADGTLDRGEAEDNEDDKAKRVCCGVVVSDGAPSEKDQDDVEEASTEAKASFDQVSRNKAVDEAASAQTADPVEDAKQDLDAAKRQRDVALRGLERAEDLTAYLQKQLLELEDSSSEKAKAKKELQEDEKELQEAEKKLQEAKKKLQEAKKELKEAEQKYEAKASVRAGRVQARASACAVVAVAFGLQPPAWSSCVFVRSTVFAFWGDVLLSARIPSSLSFTELACSTSGAASVGTRLSDLRCVVPRCLGGRMAAGSLSAASGFLERPPCAVEFASCDGRSLCQGPVRPSHEDLEWIGELADSLPLKEVLRYRFKRSGHINVLEARMFKTFCKRAARLHPDSRLVGLLDSRVTLGAVAKGRSSSPALCRVLQGCLPYTLGGGVYPGNLHVYSGQNRPFLLGTLTCDGDTFKFDAVVASACDVCPQHRTKLTAAWQIDKKWQHAEPGQCRPVISVPIVEAMCGVALAWGWPRFTALLLIGFLCMLHPSEYLCLTRGDVIFPSDAMSARRIAYIHVRNPKTARFARRQHCRLEDPSVLGFLEAQFECLPFDALLYPGTKNTFRSQWNAVLRCLGIPFRKDVQGVTPGVLRGFHLASRCLTTTFGLRGKSERGRSLMIVAQRRWNNAGAARLGGATPWCRCSSHAAKGTGGATMGRRLTEVLRQLRQGVGTGASMCRPTRSHLHGFEGRG
eukprot:s1500_g10.t1